jgi:adenylate cyclase
MKEHRKLAAIMFTDIVGYTALMSRDEQKAHQIIQRSRDLLKSLIEQFNGEWLQAVGDSTLSSFASVVDAVNCALEIQRSLKDNPELTLRIGIHIGDVVFEQGEIYGDGVNVASRLETLADPGGICISGRVYGEVRNKPDIEAEFLGEKTLKNVDYPIKVYTLAVKGPPADVPEPSVDKETEPAQVKKRSRRILGVVAGIIVVIMGLYAVYSRYFAVPTTVPGPKEIRSISVLPFADMSPEKDQEYFCDGMAEELINMLAKIQGLRVIPRTSSFSFKGKDTDIRTIGRELDVEVVLEGSVRKADNQVRITAQLINVSDRSHLWSETYDRRLDDIFVVQEEISRQVVNALEVALLEPEHRVLESKPTDNLQAYDYYLRGNEYLYRSALDQDNRIALQMYETAVELDPGFALGYTRLSKVHARLYHLFYDRTEERLAKSKEAVDKALRLDPDLPEAHIALGWYYYWGRLDYDRALEHFSLAQKLQPNNSEIFGGIGYVRRRQGKFEQGLINLKKASELDPRSFRTASSLGETCYLMRDYREAERNYDRAISLSPDLAELYADKSMLYLRWQGSTAKARAVLEEARKVGAVEDPLIDHAWFLTDVFEGNYQEALDRLSSVSSEALGTLWYFIPKVQLYARIYGFMGNRQLEQANYDSARIILENKVNERPEDERFHSSLGITYAGLGRKKEAIQEGKLAVELLPVSKEAWRGLFRVEDLARIYTMVGEYDSAIDQLELLLSIPGEMSVQLLQLDPTWNPLRENPRFQKLVKEGK